MSLYETNNMLTVTLEELKIFKNNSINLVILSNYYDKKDDSNFSPLYLHEITITYNSLIKLFFNNSGKSFIPYVLNNIWNNIKGLNLINEFLKIFEEKSGINKNELSVISKIKLYKECSFSLITTKASKIFALNLDELNHAFGSAQYREDGNTYICINFLLFSETLQVGINITLPILVSNVPKSLYTNNNEPFSFDFESSDCYKLK
jgi:hypothetical protein